MKQILLIFLTFILSVSTCNRKNMDTLIKEQTMISYDDTLNRSQLDSLFFADTLSFNIKNDWITSVSTTQDRECTLYKYVYIKELTDTTGIIYTLCTYQDTLYIINKRINK